MTNRSSTSHLSTAQEDNEVKRHTVHPSLETEAADSTGRRQFVAHISRMKLCVGWISQSLCVIHLTKQNTFIANSFADEGNWIVRSHAK